MSHASWTSRTPDQVDAMVSISDLSVNYNERKALDGVDLNIPRGEIFGLLGPNGAGKSTMFRVLATLQTPTSGYLKIGGKDTMTHSREVRGQIAYMPDMAPLPSDLRAGEYLDFFAGAYGLRGKAKELRVATCLESVGLTERAGERCQRLSLGMRQRLALAKAIIHNPRLMILDEPASGLDPLARIALRDTLRTQAASGATVILSSHVMAELQDLCTSIGLLHEGKLMDAGPIHEVLSRHGAALSRVIIRAPGNLAGLCEWLSQHPCLEISARHPSKDSVEVSYEENKHPAAELFIALAEARLGVSSMHAVETTVEDVVVKLNNKLKMS